MPLMCWSWSPESATHGSPGGVQCPDGFHSCVSSTDTRKEPLMSKITASLFIALDGVVEDPADWHFPYYNDEMGAAVDANQGGANIMVFGRKTYDSFAGAWPEREAAGEEDAPFAKALGDMRKIVASNQQLEFTWRNSEQLEGDLIETVRALKNDP